MPLGVCDVEVDGELGGVAPGRKLAAVAVPAGEGPAAHRHGTAACVTGVQVAQVEAAVEAAVGGGDAARVAGGLPARSSRHGAEAGRRDPAGGVTLEPVEERIR